MRRRIRLTGRRQLSRSCVAVKAASVPGKRLLTFGIVDQAPFRAFPKDALISVRLFENKLVEVVNFGTVGSPAVVADLKNHTFVAPSCQLRIATPVQDSHLLLGSTDTWTLVAEEEQPDKSKKGILYFQPQDIAPRAWQLDIREDDYPVVFIDKRIPEPRTWARTDTVFINCAFPAILFQVFDEILRQSMPDDIEWMSDWLKWADMLMPGNRPPLSGSPQERRDWIDDVIDSFCHRHRLSDSLVKHLTEGAVS